MLAALPRWSIRLAALAALAAVAGRTSSFARDDFLRATLHDLNARERQALESRVAELGNPDPVVRKRAVDFLVAIGAPARPLLLETLRDARDAKLVRNACLALGAFGDVTSLALLEKWFLERAPGEEPSRAALLALARGRSPLSPELAQRLRKLVDDAPIPTVREAAALCAGIRRIALLPELLKRPLQEERSARVRGLMLVALAEGGDVGAAALIAPFLDGRKVRDGRLRRAALYAVARLAEPALLEPLLKFEPGDHEIAAYAVALGAFADPPGNDGALRPSERLGRLLVRERERAKVAVHSLANHPTPESKEWLERALAGEFSDEVRAEAALAVADLTDQQRFLPRLRELATARVADPAKATALLTLARIGDAEAAATIAEALPLWREPEVLERGLLLCGLTLRDRRAADLLPEARAAPVRELWQEIDAVQTGTKVLRLLEERVAAALTAARASWPLARDDVRMAVVRELLELDRVVFVERDGAQPPPEAPPPSDGGGAPPGGDGGDTGGPPRRGGKQDTARIELDLLRWLLDYPPFDLADAFSP